VQEALTNVARHAHAHKVSVTLRENDEAIDVTIRDDGAGFDADELQKKPDIGQERGWGLVGMYERAHLLDGTLTIDAKPGKGTTVRAHIPVQQQTPLSEALVTSPLLE
jgi:two-component system sensor histidine kinase UhpB